ncbi:MAG: restriction endonuclease [Polyangiaceae bacterium]|nr:restriction endonuclease [Polyangiaceae bacterium]
MTFTDAAAQVLRLVGKPLHYKEITDVAIERNLLSHVGKNPEVTMGARLAALVKKGDKDNPLVRIKPGVFALREWDRSVIERGLADRTPALQRLAEQSPEPIEEEPSDPAASEGPAVSAPVEEDEEEAGPVDPAEAERAELAAVATAMFAPEEDDDEPILGGSDEGSEEEERRGPTERDGSRRRRRRKRRGRGTEEGHGADRDLPSYTIADAPAELIESIDVEQERRDREQERRDREQERDRDQDRGRGRPRPEGAQVDDTANLDLADTVARLLAGFDRNGGPVALGRLLDIAQRRERLQLGDVGVTQRMLVTAMRVDNQRLMLAGRRPRFRIQEGRVALTDWLLDPELARLERELSGILDRCAEASRRSLLRRLQELPQRAIGELVLLVLERAGMRQLQVVKRPGNHGGDLQLSGRQETAAGLVPTAVVVRRDGREVGRERVTELRGSLHHYGPAAAGWLVTTGQVLSGAREEAASPGGAPIALTDGIGLVRLCEQNGVAVQRVPLTLSMPDLDLLESLKSG